MTAEQLLEQAALVVRRAYGQLRELFELTARRWSLVLGREVTPAQAVLCMLDLKLARLAHDSKHLVVDLIGYSLLLHELAGDA